MRRASARATPGGIAATYSPAARGSCAAQLLMTTAWTASRWMPAGRASTQASAAFGSLEPQARAIAPKTAARSAGCRSSFPTWSAAAAGSAAAHEAKTAA